MVARSYYNEINPVKAEALRELIRMGLIPEGDVDERSILCVNPDDLRGYTQCHWFAGIGVWAYALRLAQWPDEQPVWTASPPCQPWSKAGLKRGEFDERHLWPACFNLVSHCRPPVLFAEQISAEESIGSIQRKPATRPKPTSEWAWIDNVQFDLEAASYAVGHRSFPAACVGAPHSRGRMYIVAHTSSTGLERLLKQRDDADQWVTGTGSVATPTCGGKVNGYWADGEWSHGEDGNLRFVKPGIEPSLDGAARTVVSRSHFSASACNETQYARQDRIEAYGDAIVAQQAEIFIRSARDAIGQ